MENTSSGPDVSAFTEGLGGWQPIQTAPTDGTEFLAHKPKIGVFAALILASDHPDCEFDGGVHCGWDHKYVEGVTHWMPLPAGPGCRSSGCGAPLTEEQIEALPVWKNFVGLWPEMRNEITRAVEAAHRIKPLNAQAQPAGGSAAATGCAEPF